MGHARALLPLGDEHEQTRLTDRIVAEGLSVRTIETVVQEILRADENDGQNGSEENADRIAQDGNDEATAIGSVHQRRSGRPATRRSSQIVAVENKLRRALGTKVVVHATSKGSGRIVIPFVDLSEFQRLLEHMAG